MSDQDHKQQDRELQRVVLELTRTREAKLDTIQRKEAGEGVSVAACERGAAWGLSVALNRPAPCAEATSGASALAAS